MKLTLILFLLAPLLLVGQSEINWTVNLNTQQITQTDRRVFETLEKDLAIFLNGRTWTNDRFEPEERIDATIFLTITEQTEKNSQDGEQVIPNRYSGTLAIQTSRPIYGTGEVTPILNYQDKNISFGYEQFAAIQLSEQSYTSELSSLMGFYAYLVLGLDYDTFSPMGGQPYYEQAQEIYNRLPSAVANSPGWSSGNKSNNRSFLLENLLSPRMVPVRRALYTYHRLGLDQMLTDPVAGRNNITLAIEDVQAANQSYPSSALVQSFVDAKRDEIVEIYKGATGPEQNAVIQMMSRIDPSKSGDYRLIRSSGPATSRGTTINRGPNGRQ
ncbi:hypothetical protein GGR28_000049 [Lewinella aquimaris]|uniref:DUF4835 domain-containing protein n=1 Tax=Neolewinella aquimaris TaxID=1835722 RepID=A0A840E5Q0_9BACT|nr:DUF4835 family protein [Neolewinella aquimaris]MBB4077448.1 hypothetical protein [Neolewinella aquimaris]